MLAIQRNAVIAANASLSGAIDLGDCSPVVLEMPAAWDAANLTLQFSADGSTFNNVYDKDGNEYTITAAASRSIILDLADMLGLGLVKLRSGTAASAVNQTAERTITVLGRLVE